MTTSDGHRVVKRPDISPAPQSGEAGIAEALTPRQIVEELDEYIIGQDEAKKAVAIALRNRWRRQNVEEGMREEILPNNIILIGPTGVGKTEIARRLSRLAGAPFIKVEASKFTEVGYVGRDVESIIRDLVEIAINIVREEQEARHAATAEQRVEDRLLDLLLPPVAEREPDGEEERRFVVSLSGQASETQAAGPSDERKRRTREKLRALLRDGALDEREVEIEVSQSPMRMLDLGMGTEGIDLGEALKGMLPKRTRRRQVSVAAARRILRSQELENLVDMEKVTEEALHRTQSMGIVFLDEIDKVAGKRSGTGPDVSREGVQRDLLPIVEGSTVKTRHGMVRTDHILFIAAGAFHVAKPSDLIPELQGRFPIRVELESLDADAFARILREPRYALLSQYQALVETESVRLEFDEEAIREIARIASHVNERTENIGARRLHTVLSTLLEKILFDLPEAGENDAITVDAEFVRERLARIADDEDLRRYIL
ncbi:ATP-dependent protease ATPase subunit HslU [Candidatus Palauibacter sp.]|uniref:ATP-dependent protease ATPase subunit HslU n=1 Tax=Candidatus Palauibacter sp. TaxID=3101350 RepID=UPI003B02B205